MKHWRITNWCNIAVAEIHYPPDRKAVFEELRQHLDERSDYYLEQGYEEKEAIEKTLEVMGDATELAPMLGAIHRPFWGFAYATAKVLAAILAIACAIVLSVSIVSDLWTKGYSEPSYGTYNPYFDTKYEHSYPDINDAYSYQIDQWKPSGETSFGGYTYKLNECAQWYDAFYNKNVIHTKIRVTNYFPWAHTPDSDHLMEAADNLGNHYINIKLDRNGKAYRVFNGNSTKIAPFVWIWEIEIHGPNFENVEWIEIYSRGSEQFKLRIDMAGGGSQ